MVRPLAFICGGGELGTGVGHALVNAGLDLLVVDRPLPGALRLGVAFAAAAVEGQITVEGVTAVHCPREPDVDRAWEAGQVPVWTRAERDLPWRPAVWVDARMRRLTEPLCPSRQATVTMGVGPGFEAGRDVDFVIESNRGPRLGRVIRSGCAEEHTGIPGNVLGYRQERMLRAPQQGTFVRTCCLGDFVEPGDVVGYVGDSPVRAKLAGMIRGLKLSGVEVGRYHKVGDVDPRRDRTLLRAMTDKARAVGTGALEALTLAGVLPLASRCAQTSSTGTSKPLHGKELSSCT